MNPYLQEILADFSKRIAKLEEQVNPKEPQPSGDWWKGDPTCGGLTENYGLGERQTKETKAYWGKDNCFVDVRLPDSETEVIRFWNDQLNDFYDPKTLTDEEIKQVMSKFYSYNPRLLEFARAILRKAQENE